MSEDDKRAAAHAAIAEIEAGMRVGIGTGSTVAHLIGALAERVAKGLKITAFATSEGTARAAFAAGIVVHDFADARELDLAIDGADEIDARFFAIKGGGGAMLREKVVASAAKRMVVIADGSKRVNAIGGAPVPIEVLPFAKSFVSAQVAMLGASPVLRVRKGEPVETDNGNHILDCRFAALSDPRATAAALSAIPGALGHGLFLGEVDAAYVAASGVVTRLERDRTND